MKFPQIFKFLVLFSFFTLISCKESNVKEKNIPKEEINIPSAEKHQPPKSNPKKKYSKPSIHSRDSILKKRKKSKDLDTLKPKVA